MEIKDNTNVRDVLSYIQKNLKVPKTRFNSHTKHKYRNCDDILEAIKPLMPDGCFIVLDDSIKPFGDRVYVSCVAYISFKEDKIGCEGFAREADEKKGIDPCQITGTASSYARKYALNGLFMIDDSEDADSMDNTEVPDSPEETVRKESLFQLKKLFMVNNKSDEYIRKALDRLGFGSLDSLDVGSIEKWTLALQKEQSNGS